ncbi:MAG TPA: hypothetical protein VND64_36220 [Pirellulales bacterium]|nr:hypothetical protein [Pirellulales bacterium]
MTKRSDEDFIEQHDDLRRMPPEFYRGQAYVHWTMTIDERRTGWLKPIVYYKLRELLTHTMFRYALTCPLFCCMPDHLHFVWLGILDTSDQRLAAKFFRAQLNRVLEKLDVRLQKQPYDHVLREDERLQTAFENVIEYIARNPERAGLVPVDAFREYKYTSCLLPGYPDLSPWQDGFWELFWRLYSRMRLNGLILATQKED